MLLLVDAGESDFDAAAAAEDCLADDLEAESDEDPFRWRADLAGEASSEEDQSGKRFRESFAAAERTLDLKGARTRISLCSGD